MGMPPELRDLARDMSAGFLTMAEAAEAIDKAIRAMQAVALIASAEQTARCAAREQMWIYEHEHEIPDDIKERWIR